MKVLLVPILTCLISLVCLGQVHVTDLKPAHATALEQFIAKQKGYRFLPETSLDADYLKQMREYYKNLKPYYQVGDFNRDGIADFAVIVSRPGKPKDQGEGMAETHRYNRPLAVIIFNGGRNGRFAKAFVEDIEAPLACFLNSNLVRKKRELYFGVFETDDIRMFKPKGKTYVVAYPDMP